MAGTSCAFFWGTKIKTLDEREITFEKAKALVAAEKYNLAEPLLLSLVAEPESSLDALYDQSLWRLSLVYEKMGYPEKAILALSQLSGRAHYDITRFRILISLMKNYYLVGNPNEALRLKAIIDLENPKFRLNADAAYLDILQTLNLNYDLHISQELDYVAEVQKYLLFVMEQKQSKSNQHATELLISIYQRAFDQTKNDKLSLEFKGKILISLLDNLHRFENYRLDDLNASAKTVGKFAAFSEKLQKQITERLHQ